MDIRAQKLLKARKKLKDHQEKKSLPHPKTEEPTQIPQPCHHQEPSNDTLETPTHTMVTEEQKVANNYYNANELQCNQEEMKNNIVTEILISNKTDLEMQLNDLNGKIAQLEYQYGLEVYNHNSSKQTIVALQSEVNDIQNKYTSAVKEASAKDNNILNLTNINKSLKDENSNLSEQLEFTKSILTTKEFENAQLQNQLFSYQSQLDQLQLQIQQLTNDSSLALGQDTLPQQITVLTQKIPHLEQKIETLQKDRDHLQSHYEHYVNELNEQVKSEMIKNENLRRDLQNLSDRETSLIGQISDMEIRLQNYNKYNTEISTQDNNSDTEKTELENQLKQSKNQYEELQKKYSESLNRLQALTQEKEMETSSANICEHDNVDINKLTADMASDKLAAQRATEQNKKLKLDIEGLEQVIVKMGKDKLDLTEKWMHEKQLNKGLSLKLAEVEENAKTLLKQIKAKDDEMIRLQGEYREIEHKYNILLEEVNQVKNNDSNHEEPIDIIQHNGVHCEENHKDIVPLISESVCQKMEKESLKNTCIQKEDAMVKLQERFLTIMDEVANLSDEKHRLEHIILQLQNETDTICEYVAIYQQQRSLLKRREEERTKQLKIFQTECDNLKQQLEDLSELLLSIAADEQFALLFKEESRHNDLVRVKELLQNLQNCSLINPKFNNFDLNVFYPCSCCSGQLIDV